MEPIDEEAWDLVDLEDFTEFEQILNSTTCIENANEDYLQQSTSPEEPVVLDLLINLLHMA